MGRRIKVGCGPIRLACLVMLVWIAAGEFRAFSETRHVLVLYDERTELPGLAMIDAGIRQTLASGPEHIEVYIETMDNARFDSPGYRDLLGDHLWSKYAGKRIDVAMAVMGPALEFLLKHRATIFPNAPETPIVFCGISPRTFRDRPVPPAVTGVLLRREFAPSLKLALGLHPDTERIMVVAGSSDFDRSVLKLAREEFRPFEDRRPFIYNTNKPLRELLAELSALPPRTLILYTTMFRDGADQAYVPHEVAQRISATANAPVYGFLDQYVGHGIVGGRLYSLTAHGEAAAGLVLKILSGTSTAALPPIEPDTSVTSFDWRQLRRWQISEDRLPPGSTILFRNPSLWQRYKWHMLGIAAICIGQSVLIGLLVVNLAKRRAAEATVRESEKRMTLAAEAGRLGMWVWESSNVHMWVSEKWRSIYGYSPEEDVYFDAMIRRVHPEDRSDIERTIGTALKDKNVFDIQHRLLLPNGNVRWISSTGRVESTGKNGCVRLVGISIDITERKEAEDAALEVSGKLITAQEDERRRIARDLHDDLNQRLALLSVEADLLGQIDHDPSAQPLISEIASNVRSLSSEVHKLSYQLHPAKLEQLGLVSATRSFCQEISTHSPVGVEFVHNAVPREINRTVGLCLYRIVQESLQNTIKHSHATAARVELNYHTNALWLVISDNGQGCELGIAARHQGLGLVGMRERVRLVRGQIVFHSARGQGMRIEVVVPSPLREPANGEVERLS